MENRTYIIGRKGNIQLFDKTASAHHAELVISDGDLYLTDLNSKNGTYLMDAGKRKPFKEGHIQMNQTLAFGRQICTVRELIARATLA